MRTTINKIDPNMALNLSVALLNAYCRKDLAWFRSHIDDRTFLIGPRIGQVWRSGAEILNAWTADIPMPEFSVSDIKESSIGISTNACDVLLGYNVTWHKADGTDFTHPQIMQISWILKDASAAGANKKEENYKIAVMHFSNPEELDERDLAYNTFGDISISTISRSLPRSSQPGEEQWIMIPGVNAVLSRYPAGSVIWIESASSAHKCIVHARDQNIRSAKTVLWFMRTYPGVFLQPSVSYLVNPVYVKTIKRFQIELWNGKVLRVPEKKYYQFKRDFEAFFQGK